MPPARAALPALMTALESEARKFISRGEQSPGVNR